MKKLFVSALAIGALCLSNCGNKTTKVEATTDSLIEVPLYEATTDSISDINTLANTLQEQLKNKDIQGFQNTLSSFPDKYQELLKSGKVEEAKEYAKKIKEIVDANSDKIKEYAKDNKTVSTLINQVKGFSLDTKSDIKAGAEEIQSNIKEGVDKVKENSSDATKKAEESVKDAVKKLGI
ncbi:MAG: hypothetical protein ACTTHI_05720 [Prevotella sp.]